MISIILSFTSIVINTILSTVTIIIAVRAFKQGNKQIEISNKQSLFKERLVFFNKFKVLYNTYKNNITSIDYLIEIPNYEFHLFANNIILEDVIEVVYKPLDSEKHNELLRKKEQLEEISLYLELLWNCEDGVIASNFVNAYIKLIMALYKQQIFINSINTREELELDEYHKKINENAKKLELDNLKSNIDFCYNQIKSRNVLNDLKEEIRLK